MRKKILTEVCTEYIFKYIAFYLKTKSFFFIQVLLIQINALKENKVIGTKLGAN
jgi:hypothetical protein